MIQKFSVMTERGARTLEFIWRHWIPMMAFNHFLSHWIAPFLHRDTPAHRAKSNTEIAFSALYLAGYAAVGALAYRAGVLGSLIAFSTILWIVLLMAVELLNLPHHAEIPLLADDAARPPLWEQDVVSQLRQRSPLVTLGDPEFQPSRRPSCVPWLPWYDLPRAQRLLDAVSTAEAPRQTHEWAFAVTKRRRPLLELMGHFFDKRGASSQGGR